MTTPPISLDNLISYVKAVHPQGGPLDNLSDAVSVCAQLDEQSDALIAGELAGRLVAAPSMSERQLRRIVYG